VSEEEKSLARREFIKRIAMAGAFPAVVAVIAAQGGLKAEPTPAPNPQPAPAPGPAPGPAPSSVPEIPGLMEPGTMVAMGLGIAGMLAAALREKKKDDSGSDSEK